MKKNQFHGLFGADLEILKARSTDLQGDFARFAPPAFGRRTNFQRPKIMPALRSAFLEIPNRNEFRRLVTKTALQIDCNFRYAAYPSNAMHFVLFNFFKGAHVVCALACWLFVAAVLAPTQANPLWGEVSANAICSLPNSVGSDGNDAHDVGCCVLGCAGSVVVAYLLISIDVVLQRQTDNSISGRRRDARSNAATSNPLSRAARGPPAIAAHVPESVAADC